MPNEPFHLLLREQDVAMPCAVHSGLIGQGERDSVVSKRGDAMRDYFIAGLLITAVLLGLYTFLFR